MRTLQLTVLVDQAKANPVTILTEPPLEGRPLAAFGQWIGEARRDLKDGEYTLTLGAAEDGIQGVGPDKRSVDLLRRKLVEPMSETQDDLTAAYAFQDLDDAQLVERVSVTVADGIGSALAFLPPDHFVPGFLRLQVVGTEKELDLALLQSEVDMLSAVETDEAGRQYVDHVLDKAAALGVTPRPAGTHGPLDVMVLGIPPRNLFAKGANAKLRDRLGLLAPQIEAAVMARVVANIAGMHERTGTIAASLRQNFNLG